MSFMQKIKCTVLIAMIGFFPYEPLLAVIQWGSSVQATPTKYEVNIRRVSFRNTQGQWVTYVDQLFPMNIASKNPGAAIGTLGAGVTIQPGTYNAMRFHIGTSFTINASANVTSSIGAPGFAFTNGGTATTDITNFGAMFRASVAENAAPRDQVLQMPITPTTQAQMEAQGMAFETIDGLVYMLAVMPFDNHPFTITNTSRKMPVIQMDFDVTNAVDFFVVPPATGLSSTVAVMPAGPGLALYVNGDLAFSMNR